MLRKVNKYTCKKYNTKIRLPMIFFNFFKKHHIKLAVMAFLFAVWYNWNTVPVWALVVGGIGIFLSLIGLFISRGNYDLIKEGEIGEMPFELADKFFLEKYCQVPIPTKEDTLDSETEAEYIKIRNKYKHLIGTLVIEPTGFELAILVAIIRDKDDVAAFLYRTKDRTWNIVEKPVEVQFIHEYSRGGRVMHPIDRFFEQCYD